MKRPCAREVALTLKQEGELAEGYRGLGMVGAAHLLADRQRALEQRPRAREVALLPKQPGEVVEGRRSVGMLGAARFLADRQRALEQRPRAGEVALNLKHEGEVVNALGRIRMFGAERLLADRQRALEPRSRARVVALSVKQVREFVEAVRRIRMFGAERLLADRQRAVAKGPGLRIGPERRSPIRPKPIQKSRRCPFRAARRERSDADQFEIERVEPPRARPQTGLIETYRGIYRRHRFDQSPTCRVTGFALQPPRRHRLHQPMQPDRLRYDRRFALVHDRLAIDQRKSAQRR